MSIASSSIGGCRDGLRRTLLALASLGLATVVVHAQVRERVLYVTARDASGAPVEQLVAGDLVVREDGVAREVLRVRPATAPLHVALLVDNSQASTNHIANLREALPRFIDRFGPPHELTLVTLGDRPTIVTEYTSSREALRRGIERLFPQSGAGLYVLDGITEAARGLQRREAGRPVIVVVATDGIEFSNLSYEPVLDALTAAGAALHVIEIQDRRTTALTSVEVRNREILYDRGTRDTGGSRELLLTSMALGDALSRLADLLLRQWEVVYARPTTLIPPEKVTVAATRPDLDVRGTPARMPRGETR